MSQRSPAVITQGGRVAGFLCLTVSPQVSSGHHHWVRVTGRGKELAEEGHVLFNEVLGTF